MVEFHIDSWVGKFNFIVLFNGRLLDHYESLKRFLLKSKPLNVELYHGNSIFRHDAYF